MKLFGKNQSKLVRIGFGRGDSYLSVRGFFQILIFVSGSERFLQLFCFYLWYFGKFTGKKGSFVFKAAFGKKIHFFVVSKQGQYGEGWFFSGSKSKTEYDQSLISQYRKVKLDKLWKTGKMNTAQVVCVCFGLFRLIDQIVKVRLVFRIVT